MTILIKDIIQKLDLEAPFRLAEEWDNIGLLVGSPEQNVKSILIGLDPTTLLLNEAIAKNADTILTHHPVIFKPLSTINTSLPEGKLLQQALSHNISIIACHTNLDSAAAGVSDILAERLGIKALQPLIPAHDDDPQTGLGRIGQLETPVEPRQFLDKVMAVLELPTLQVAGPLPDKVQTVAVCGGSGSDFAAAALARDADVYITAEIKHNIARWAEENNFCIIDGTHYATEKPAVALLADKLNGICADNGWQIRIMESETENHPFHYIQQTDLRSS
ncbi:Nif3-like dinuclear metal center hexameric protein [Desulfopila sp. IMCC35008]|uniref:Nif3-like dinuclear metal center hexameric protein n=1 Tax=Desulfopila sp. IMCC35008 TaxID=2653858 RepID=UPI0013D74F5B|nr:Nif3-like dinuclear metal center hexameric protein [Desulfopila sp. IMCC35008]